MKVVYASRTGNIEKFLAKAGVSDSLKIVEGCEKISNNYILITYTSGLGEIPKEVENFVKHNSSFLKGVIGSGNRNWGSSYCNGAKLISQNHNIPLLMTFELSGRISDVVKFKRILNSLTT